MSEATKRRAKPKLLEGVPVLMTHREVAGHFRVTPTCLKRWVEKGEFPEPHSIIAQTWFYREDMIVHKLRTGRWAEGARFKGYRR